MKIKMFLPFTSAPLPPSSASVDNSAATNTSIDVTWNKVDTSYFIKYIIEFTKESDISGTEVEATVAETRKKITGLDAGVKYTINVFTVTKENVRSLTSANTEGTVSK